MKQTETKTIANAVEKKDIISGATEDDAPLPEDLDELHAAHGAGPLLQRDYWVCLPYVAQTPEGIMQLLAHEFPSFAPSGMADFAFTRLPPLQEGDEMKVHIRGYGDCHVRVVSREERTLTLLTLEDHYEAGRITFGAWTDEQGQTILKIRSRARSRSTPHALSFLLIGHLFQKQMWFQFLENLAETIQSQGIAGENEPEIKIEVQESTVKVEEDESDNSEENKPTFSA